LNDISVNDTKEVRSSTYRDILTRSDGSSKSYLRETSENLRRRVHGRPRKSPKRPRGDSTGTEHRPVRGTLIHVKSRLNKCCRTKKVDCAKEDWNEHYGVNTKKE